MKGNAPEIVLGIDDGSKSVGIALVQKCATHNKPVFKGVIELRQDIKHLMDVRRSYRRYKRNHKRYRPARFHNRTSSKRKGRIAPSIKQKKDAVLRVVKQLNKVVPISKIVLEDVAIDIRAMTEGYKPYRWQYQKSNRLDENLRKATILRDGCKCKMCGKDNCILEVHHITPRKFKGADTLNNLITLCSKCHNAVAGVELGYKDTFYGLTGGSNIRFDYAQHVMQGKAYLREGLSKVAPLELATGGDTANKRIDWDIEKTHSNDAICITGLRPSEAGIRSWNVKPMRRKTKAKIESLNGFAHRDIVKYTKRSGEAYVGYITALYPEKKQCNITTLEDKILKRYGIKSLAMVWRFNKIQWT